MQVLLVAAKKDMVLSFADLIREAGLSPVVIDVDSFAIQNALAANYDFAPGEVDRDPQRRRGDHQHQHRPERRALLHQGSAARRATFVDAVQRRYNVTREAAAAALAGQRADLDVVPVVEQTCESLATASSAPRPTCGPPARPAHRPLMLAGGGR